MPDLATIISETGPAYLARYGERMLPSHRRALQDLSACRTEALGGHLAQCDRCGYQHYSYHSCHNRSCPQCHTSDTERWLDKRQSELLPVPYFHVIFTLPEELREVTGHHQKTLYAVLLKAAAQSLLKLTADPRYVGGRVGILSVLHTWTRQLIHHPHAHCLVTGGGLTKDGQWQPARKAFLVPAQALSKIFRAKFMAMANKALPEVAFPETVWDKDWVVYCKPAIQGSRHLLNYLGRYVHRIAITNGNILVSRNGQVTFRYRDSKEHRWKKRTLPAMEFLRRFLCHVLPRGFHKVRYYGLLSPQQRSRLKQLQLLLTSPDPPEAAKDDAPSTKEALLTCPNCHEGLMVILSWIAKGNREPP